MNRRRLLLTLSALTMGGCATRSPGAPPVAGEPAGLEPLHAVTAGRDGVTIRAASSGCTRKEDFAFYLERGGLTPTLAFGRRRLDTCRSFVAGHVDMTFGWSELGLASGGEFVLLNPLTAQPAP